MLARRTGLNLVFQKSKPLDVIAQLVPRIFQVDPCARAARSTDVFRSQVVAPLTLSKLPATISRQSSKSHLLPDQQTIHFAPPFVW